MSRQKIRIESFYWSPFCHHNHKSKKNRLTIDVVIVAKFFVLENAFPDGRGVHPCDEVLHASGDDECRIFDHVRTDSDVTLLDQLRRRPEVFDHLWPDENDWKSWQRKNIFILFTFLFFHGFVVCTSQFETILTGRFFYCFAISTFNGIRKKIGMN